MTSRRRKCPARKLIGEKGAVGAFHRRSGQRAISSPRSSRTSPRANRAARRSRRRAAVIDDDNGTADVDGTRPSVSRTRSATISAMTPRSASPSVNVKSEAAACRWLELQLLQIAAQRGADRALRADEKRNEDELAFAARASLRATHGASVQAGTPSSAAAGMRSLCFQETGMHVHSRRCATTPAATARRFRCAAGSSEPLSISATIMRVTALARAASNHASLSARHGHFADDHDGGRAEAGVFGFQRDLADGGEQLAVFAGGGGLHDRDGRLRAKPARLQAPGDRLEIFHPHVNAQRGAKPPVVFPADRGVRLCRVFVAGQKNDRRSVCAMGERNAGVRRRRQRRRDAGNDFERESPPRPDASASSPPRPKMKGSPPFSRTTVFPSRASRMRVPSISRCGQQKPPPFLPTKTRSASDRASARISGATR